MGDNGLPLGEEFSEGLCADPRLDGDIPNDVNRILADRNTRAVLIEGSVD
jgi:hypothetical protein